MTERSLLVPYRTGEGFSDEALWALETRRREVRNRLLLSIEPIQRRMEVLKADRALCVRDPIYWMENYAYILNPHADRECMSVVPMVLWPAQQRLVRWLIDRHQAKEDGLIQKGRKLGATWTCLLLIKWFFNFQRYFRARMGSNKEDQVDGAQDTLFGMLRFIHTHEPEWLRPDVGKWLNFKLRMRNPKMACEIVGESANKGFGRGGRRGITLIDEFAHIDTYALQQSLWASIQTGQRTAWLVSTPRGRGTLFASFERTWPERKVFRMDWRDDPLLTEEWAEQRIKEIGQALFDQEHGGKSVTLHEGTVFHVSHAHVSYNDEKLNATYDSPRMNLNLMGGWDFGSGPSLLVCLHALIQFGTDWKIWVDSEICWQRQDWQGASTQVRELEARRYGQQWRAHVGDPAGIQKDSGQTSWEINLRAGGIPITCLPGEFNTRQAIDWMIQETQQGMSDGRIMVHEDCKYLWECLGNWCWNVPTGIDPAIANKIHIPPAHDQYSHGGMALCYLIAGALRLIMTADSKSDRGLLVSEGLMLPSPGGEINDILARSSGLVLP